MWTWSRMSGLNPVLYIFINVKRHCVTCTVVCRSVIPCRVCFCIYYAAAVLLCE